MTTYADATDKTVDTWKQGAKTMTERMEFLVTTPSLDFIEPVERYFDFLQRAVDLNRELLTRWAELATQMSGTLRDEALKAGHTMEEQVEDAADKAGELARKGKDTVDKVVDEVGTVVDEAVRTGKARPRTWPAAASTRLRRPRTRPPTPRRTWPTTRPAPRRRRPAAPGPAAALPDQGAPHLTARVRRDRLGRGTSARAEQVDVPQPVRWACRRAVGLRCRRHGAPTPRLRRVHHRRRSTAPAPHLRKPC